MRLTSKKTEEILISILGADGISLIRELQKQDNTSEFQLAAKTKKDIKIIRKMLYLLYNNNLVSFTRKKDKEKGWYIYSWTLVPESVKYLYYKKKKEFLERLEHRLEEEKKELFFSCPNTCIRLNFDQATDFDFHCPECGELLAQDITEEKIVAMQKEATGLRHELTGALKESTGKGRKKSLQKAKKEKQSKVNKVKRKGKKIKKR